MDYCLNFLIEKENDDKYVKNIEKKYNIPKNKIYLQVVGTDPKSIISSTSYILGEIIENSWNLNLRYHNLFKYI